MRNKIFCATSFGKEGIKLYAKEMIQSFIQYWPEDVILKVYLDDIESAKLLPQARNIEYILLDNPVLLEFKNRNISDPRKSGIMSSNQPSNFLFDSIRFSHKVFALEACARSGADLVLWLDGDTKTFSKISREVINSWLPVGKFAGFLHRPTLYTETGFHIFDMNHELADKFFKEWIKYYEDDSIYSLVQWTDCHTYDAARQKFDQKYWFDLSPQDLKVSHVFINGVLGKYMDHMKGKRKIIGHSSRKDLARARDEDYWKTK